MASQLAYLASILAGVALVLFLIFALLGDPARMLAGQRADQATLANIRAELGTDLPVWQQLLRFFNDISPLGMVPQRHLTQNAYPCHCLYTTADGSCLAIKQPWLRTSYQNGRPVLHLFLERLPATALLATASMALALALGIPLGVVAASKAGRWPDRLLGLLALTGVSAPSFFAALGLLWLFAMLLYPYTGLPLGGYVVQQNVLTPGSHLDLRYLLLPALTLGIRPVGIIFQLTREQLLLQLGQDYTRTARAKGASPRRVLLYHALPNALVPVAGAATGWFASLLAGAFFVEFVFNWPGIGKLLADGLFANDYPVLLGGCLLTAVIFVLMNSAANLLYHWLDPRLRVQS